MEKFISIILIFFLGGCYTKCGLHYDYRCECKEYYDVNGQYFKECPESLDQKAIRMYKQQTNQNAPQQSQIHPILVP